MKSFVIAAADAVADELDQSGGGTVVGQGPLHQVVGSRSRPQRGAVRADDDRVPALERDQHLVHVGRHRFRDRRHGEDDADRTGDLTDAPLVVGVHETRARLTGEGRVYTGRAEQDLLGFGPGFADAGLGDGGRPQR